VPLGLAARWLLRDLRRHPANFPQGLSASVGSGDVAGFPQRL
jgi:hypothetical protein